MMKNLYKDEEKNVLYILDETFEEPIESNGVTYKYNMLKDPKEITGQLYFSGTIMMTEERFNDLLKIR